jgi:hypothetical protein
MRERTEPGTIDDLVADAAEAGSQVGVRLIRDWTQHGLLDSPLRRPAGKGHGSRAALYTASQRNLFLTLLSKRGETGSIRSLARIPVFIWLYWGDSHVPLRQARRSFMTWLGDPRASKHQARTSAQAVLGQLAHPKASEGAKRALLTMLTDIAYTGQADTDKLEQAIRAVFEPGDSPIRRAIGHPNAALTTESTVQLIQARMAACQHLANGTVTDDDFVQAREEHRLHTLTYQQQQPLFAAHTPTNHPDMYEVLDPQTQLNRCCDHLLLIFGLRTLNSNMS